MSEEILQQLVKMVAANNRQQAELKEIMEKTDKRMTGMEERMTSMEARMTSMEKQMTSMEERMTSMGHDIREVKTYMYRIERLERQLDKTISQASRLAVDVEMLQQKNN